MSFTISYLILILFLLLAMAYWSLSVLLPKSPPTNLPCLLIRTFIGVGFAVGALYMVFIILALTI